MSFKTPTFITWKPKPGAFLSPILYKNRKSVPRHTSPATLPLMRSPLTILSCENSSYSCSNELFVHYFHYGKFSSLRALIPFYAHRLPSLFADWSEGKHGAFSGAGKTSWSTCEFYILQVTGWFDGTSVDHVACAHFTRLLTLLHTCLIDLLTLCRPTTTNLENLTIV